MVELIHKRNWNSKVFDTGQVQQIDGEPNHPIYGSKLQNGLHDIDPDGSFVECDMTIETITNGVTTHQIKRGRYGELRFGDILSTNKHLCKIKYKDGNGISLKYLGADSGLPIINGDVKFAAADGMQLRHIPTYKGVKLELITNDPLTASLEYAFSIKTYGQIYAYEIISGSIIATGEDGKTITIHTPYAIDANGDIGKVNYELLGVVDELMTFKKIVDETWLRGAAAPVKIDPNITIEDGVAGGVLEEALLPGNVDNTYNYGGLGFFESLHQSSHDYTSLLRADLSSLSGITVINGYFGFDVYTGNFPVTLFSWYKVLIEWGEGTSSGAAESGACSAAYAKWSTNSWNNPLCKGVGTDRNVSAEGTKTISATNTDEHLDITQATIQKWIDSPSINYGIVMEHIGAINTYFEAYSSESGETNLPYFYMEYTEANGGGFPFFFG